MRSGRVSHRATNHERALLQPISFLLEVYFFASPFVFMLLWVWSREFPNNQVSHLETIVDKPLKSHGQIAPACASIAKPQAHMKTGCMVLLGCKHCHLPASPCVAGGVGSHIRASSVCCWLSMSLTEHRVIRSGMPSGFEH